MLLLVCVQACTDPQGPAQGGPPYLAILPRISGPDAGTLPSVVRYRVRMLSAPSIVDTVLARAPRDTVILSLPPAAYRIDLDGLPLRCNSRDGTIREAVLFADANTSIVRFNVTCLPSLVVRTKTLGNVPTQAYALRVSVGDSVVRDAVMQPTDSLYLDDVAPATYRLELRSLPQRCGVISTGGTAPLVMVPPRGGAELTLFVDCSNPADRPSVVSLAASYRHGALGFVARVADPNRDVDRYTVDLTDCRGASLLPTGARTRAGVATSLVGPDTVTIVAAIEPGLPDAVARNACASFRAIDLAGNSSPTFELPLSTDSAQAPQAIRFNAVFNGTSSVAMTLSVLDPDDDFVGAFIAFTLRDGALGQAIDGRPEFGILAVNGVRGNVLPSIPLGGGRPEYGDFLSVIVYLLDARGNMTRLVDTDLIR